MLKLKLEFGKTAVYVLGAVLAIAQALVLSLHLGSDWAGTLSTAVIVLGLFGVRALQPSEIAAKIPPQIGAVVASVLGVLLIVSKFVVHMPNIVTVIIGVVLTIGVTIGIHITLPGEGPTKPIQGAIH